MNDSLKSLLISKQKIRGSPKTETETSIINKFLSNISTRIRRIHMLKLKRPSNIAETETETEFGYGEVSEMANLLKDDTGLPYTIWLDSAGAERRVSHNTPRLKVDVNGDKIPMSISQNRVWSLKDFPKKSEVAQWVIDNYDILIKHWNKEIPDKEVKKILRKKSLN